MSEVKRYQAGAEIHPLGGEPRPYHDEVEDGDWVKHADHLSAIAELRAENEALREVARVYLSEYEGVHDMNVPRAHQSLAAKLAEMALIEALSPDSTTEGE